MICAEHSECGLFAGRGSCKSGFVMHPTVWWPGSLAASSLVQLRFLPSFRNFVTEINEFCLFSSTTLWRKDHLSLSICAALLKCLPMLCAAINDNNSAVDEAEHGLVSLKAGQISADKAPSGCLHRAAPLHLRVTCHLQGGWAGRKGCRVRAVHGFLSLIFQRKLLQIPIFGQGTENWMVGKTLTRFKTSSFWKGQGKKVKNTQSSLVVFGISAFNHSQKPEMWSRIRIKYVRGKKINQALLNNKEDLAHVGFQLWVKVQVTYFKNTLLMNELY